MGSPFLIMCNRRGRAETGVGAQAAPGRDRHRDCCAQLVLVTGEMEITLEANPGSSETGRFACYRAAGVNRISIGAQALDDASLKALGADHLSLYQLTIEPGARSATLAARGELELPSEDERADMRDITLALTGKAGLNAYEVSNHARPGQECRHNLVYWRSGEWAGIGPGACGRLDKAPGTSIERRQARRPETWLSLVGQNGHGIAESEPVTGTQRLEEVLMMGLPSRAASAARIWFAPREGTGKTASILVRSRASSMQASWSGRTAACVPRHGASPSSTPSWESSSGPAVGQPAPPHRPDRRRDGLPDAPASGLAPP